MSNKAVREELVRAEVQKGLLERKLTAAKKSRQEAVESLTRYTSESETSPSERRRRDVFAMLDRIFHDPDRVPPPFLLNGRTGPFFLELIDNQTYGHAVDAWTRGQVEIIYGPWLRTLDLSPGVRTHFSQMLTDSLMFDLEVEKVVRPLGLNSDDERAEAFRMKQKLMSDFSAEGRGLVGDGVMLQLRTQTMMFGNTGGNPLEPIVRRLSYSEEPLTREQTNRIHEMVPFSVLLEGITNRKNSTKAFMEILATDAKSVLTSGQLAQVQEYATEVGVAFPP